MITREDYDKVRSCIEALAESMWPEFTEAMRSEDHERVESLSQSYREQRNDILKRGNTTLAECQAMFHQILGEERERIASYDLRQSKR